MLNGVQFGPSLCSGGQMLWHLLNGEKFGPSLCSGGKSGAFVYKIIELGLKNKAILAPGIEPLFELFLWGS
ncbi:MAG TPA: hypothetical protein PK323_14875 [Bacteroidia bacterium]|nr:hypothetical protein [Bacteroidia bacterium]